MWLMLCLLTSFDEAKAAFFAGDYAKAEALVGTASTPDALVLLGASRLALGKEDAAQQLFRRALVADPLLRPVDLGPKVTRAVDAVRAELYPRPLVRRARDFVRDLQQSSWRVVLSFEVQAPQSSARPAGVPLELCQQTCLPIGRDGRIELSLGENTRTEIAWYVRTADSQEVVLGSEAKPERDVLTRAVLKVAASAPVAAVAQPDTPFYQRWWFWLPIGVVVAGAVTGTGVYFATLPQQTPTTVSWHLVQSR